jgi:hypothetical protein
VNQPPVPVGSPSWTTVRTPHLAALIVALEARDHIYETLAVDVLRVRDISPDDLGWLMAGAGVVVYELSTRAAP